MKIPSSWPKLNLKVELKTINSSALKEFSSTIVISFNTEFNIFKKKEIKRPGSISSFSFAFSPAFVILFLNSYILSSIRSLLLEFNDWITSKILLPISTLWFTCSTSLFWSWSLVFILFKYKLLFLLSKKNCLKFGNWLKQFIVASTEEFFTYLLIKYFLIT